MNNELKHSIRNKPHYSTPKKDYFEWLEGVIEQALFDERERELDEIEASLTAARELRTEKEVQEGLDFGLRIVFDRRVQLRKEKGVL